MPILKKIACLVLMLLVSIQSASATSILISTPIPEDSKVVRGKLPNGMDYIIYPHGNPKGQVNFWLQMHSGSLQEEDDQLGIAHFVEHMLFNGTRDYPANQIIEALEKIGLKFGRDVNAYTNYAETVFQVNMATDNQENIDTVMNVFLNWAALATFDPQEVEDERGIIIEEWRSNQGIKWRNAQQRRPYSLTDSRHLIREPIGDMDIIRNISVERIKAYYDKWYQPQNMTFIVNGDIKPAEIIPLIEKTFSSMTNRSELTAQSYKMPAIHETRFNIIADDENTVNSFAIMYRYPRIFLRTDSELMASTKYSMLVQLFNQRMYDMLQAGELPDILGSMAISSGLGDDYQATYFRSTAKNNDIESAVRVLLTELERIDRYGFTQAEVDRLKRTQLAYLENAVINTESRDVRMLTGRIANASLYHTPFFSPQTRYELVQEAYKRIDLREINQEWKQLIRNLDDKVYEQIVNSQLKDKALSADQIIDLENQIKQQSLEAYEQTVEDKPLMTEKPQPGKVIDVVLLSDEIYQINLSNGAQVIVYPTQFEDKTVSFTALGDRGALSYSPQDYHAVKLATKVVNLSGLGDLSAAELKSWLAQNFTNINTAALERNVTMSVMGNQDKLEALFQTVYQRFNATKINPEIWTITKQAQENELKALENQAKLRFRQDTYEMRFADGRAGVITQETLDKLTPEYLLKLDHQLFANSAGFKFIIVGNVQLEQVRELAEQYLASLTVDQDNMLPEAIELTRNNQNVSLTLAEEAEPYAQVTSFLYHPLDSQVTEKSRQELLAFNFALSRDLRVEIREKSSGAYSVGAISQMNPIVSEFNFRLAFSCDPERYETLFNRAQEVIKQRIESGITPSELDEYKRMQLRAFEIQKSNNSQISRLLLSSYMTYGDLSLYTDTANYIEKLTVDEINTISKSLFNHQNYQFTGILLKRITN